MDFLTNLLLKTVLQVWGTFTHNWPFLLVSVLIAVAMKLYIDANKVSAFLTRYRQAGVIGATAAAVATPLCSCGTTAIILGMMTGMMPWAPIVAFMVASPLTSPEGLFYSAGLFGWPFSIAFYIASILLGLLGGLVAGIAESRGWLANQSRLVVATVAAGNQAPARLETRNSAQRSSARQPELVSLLFARDALASGTCGCGSSLAEQPAFIPPATAPAACGCGTPVAATAPAACGCGTPVAATAPVACGCGTPVAATAPATCDCGTPVVATAPVACGCGSTVVATAPVACGCGSTVVATASLPIPDTGSECGCGSNAPVPQASAESTCGCSGTAPAPVASTCGCGTTPAPAKPPVTLRLFLSEAFTAGRRLLVMFFGFAFIGYFLNGLIPQAWVTAIFGSGNIYSVPLAATLGLPLYINSEASLPLVRALIDGGMSQGAAMAFLITGAGTSIGALAGALTIARWRVIALVVGTLWVGAVIIGNLYNLLLAAGLF